MSLSENSSLAHLVFFTLKDSSSAASAALIEACRKHLTNHPGTVHFSVGPRAEAYDRPVNDSHFDVALVLVFSSQTDHDRYQTSERHEQFITEQNGNWAKVRVFDTLV